MSSRKSPPRMPTNRSDSNLREIESMRAKSPSSKSKYYSVSYCKANFITGT